MKRLFFLFPVILGLFSPLANADNYKTYDLPTYLVSTEVNYAPFIYLNNQGNIAGFDIDILSAIAEDQGFKVQFLPTDWNSLFEKVASGDTDIIAAAMTETEEGKEIFELSDPYITTHRVAILSNPKFSHFNHIEQLGGLKFSTKVGKSNEDYLKTLFGENVNIQGVHTQFQELVALLSGEVDVAYDDYYVMLPYINRERYKKKITKVIVDDKVGTNISLVFAVKKGRLNLLSKINNGLKNIKANGIYQKIYDQYFSLEQ